jgi:hypothetical protein
MQYQLSYCNCTVLVRFRLFRILCTAGRSPSICIQYEYIRYPFDDDESRALSCASQLSSLHKTCPTSRKDRRLGGTHLPATTLPMTDNTVRTTFGRRGAEIMGERSKALQERRVSGLRACGAYCT